MLKRKTVDINGIDIENADNISLSYNDCVEITEDQINSSILVPLQVRRGSEPLLNRLSPDIHVCNELNASKRWSTAVAIDCKNNNNRNVSTNSLNESTEHSDYEKSKSINSNSLSPRSIKEEGYGSEEKSENTPSSTTSNNTFSRFSRGSGRKSMIANNLDVWVEAADRQLIRKINRESPTQSTQIDTIECVAKNLNYDTIESSVSSISSEDITKHRTLCVEHSVIVNLAKEVGPLGIHVVPDSDDNLCVNGLLIRGIEPGGRIDRDGRFRVGDSIVEINGCSIRNVSFQKAQDIFKQALQTNDITLELIKKEYHKPVVNSSMKKSFAPPVLPKPENVMKQHEQLRLQEGLVEAEERGVQQAKMATVTPTKKLTNASNTNHKPAVSSTLVVSNTRKIGKKYHIQLKKGNDGLGFSITTRDNPAGGNCPIYIKTILPKGAAVEDGRLRTGDRLLEVCGIEMTGKAQSDAVKILRTIPLGTKVDLIVSRQELDMSPSPMMPRQLPPEKSSDNCWNEREVLTFGIPLNDTGSAGLGVSVKGKTSTVSGQHTDLGIFVKSVIHGGAASKDGRLKTNDQLININGIPLLGMTNSQAMETLRRAMIQSEGPIANPNAITLTVARRVPSHQLNSCHQRNDSLLSATSNDSCNDENQFPSTEYFTDKFDDTYDSYKSNENTVIYKPLSNSTNYSPNSNLQVNNHSNNTTFLKKFYLSDNHDPNATYERCTHSRNDVFIEDDKFNTDANCSHSKVNTDNLKVNGNSTHDSKQSLDDENSDGFRRDGFGRQSMSEKRHAQLDAKNTDTYRRNKKAKEEKEKLQKEKLDSRDNSITTSNQTHISHALPCQSVSHNTVVQKSFSDESLNFTGVSHSQCTDNNKRKCQSPGSCPYHSVNPQKKDVGPSLGMKKSSSLESLQTMMQDLQKEQLEHVAMLTGSARNATVRVARTRETNESFRAAVDKSYDDPNNTDNLETMETVAEEESDSDCSMEQQTHQTHSYVVKPNAAMSLASTQCTATTQSQLTTADENVNLFKKNNSGKKKGLFKTWFKFGSKKGRSSKNANVDELSERPESKIPQNSAQMYILEQERIQKHYKRLLEQQKKQQSMQQSMQQSVQQPMPQQVSLTAQPTPPARHKKPSMAQTSTQPLHSTPTGVLPYDLTMTLSRNERMQQLRAQHQRMHAERQGFYPNDNEIYESTYNHTIDRKQLDYSNSGVLPPNMCSYPLCPNFQPKRVVMSKTRHIEPIYNENIVPKYSNANVKRTYSLRCANDRKIHENDLPVNHVRGNSYDIYRQAMDRPGSRVGIADQNNKYSHYMNYKEIQQHMQQYHQQQQQQQAMNHYRHQVYSSQANAAPIAVQQSARQMRNQHRRQVSSPVSHHERPNSNFYEYDTKTAQNATVLNQQQQHMLQQSHINNNIAFNSSLRRRNNNYNVDQPQQQQQPQQTNSVPIVRQHQPIYSSNHVNIYGSIYSNGYSSSQPNHANQTYDSFQGTNNHNNHNSHYQLPSKYQSLRHGSKV